MPEVGAEGAVLPEARVVVVVVGAEEEVAEVAEAAGELAEVAGELAEAEAEAAGELAEVAGELAEVAEGAARPVPRLALRLSVASAAMADRAVEAAMADRAVEADTAERVAVTAVSAPMAEPEAVMEAPPEAQHTLAQPATAAIPLTAGSQPEHRDMADVEQPPGTPSVVAAPRRD